MEVVFHGPPQNIAKAKISSQLLEHHLHIAYMVVVHMCGTMCRGKHCTLFQSQKGRYADLLSTMQNFLFGTRINKHSDVQLLPPKHTILASLNPRATRVPHIAVIAT